MPKMSASVDIISSLAQIGGADAKMGVAIFATFLIHDRFSTFFIILIIDMWIRGQGYKCFQRGFWKGGKEAILLKIMYNSFL